VRIAPALPPGVERSAERPGPAGLHVLDRWSDELPWLVHGMTGRDADMSLFGGSPVGQVVERWTALRDALGCRAIVHARQVHAAGVLIHENVPDGLMVAPDADGHLTGRPGVLLAVSTADCVPILMAAPAARAVALLHAGWRGVAAGILERGIALLREHHGAAAGELHVHFGPAICGECYEVGPEVVAGVGLESASPTHVDLRAALAARALDCGVPAARITVSAHCTRHGDSPFYSHRGGCSERQIAVLGIRAAA
jgi:polyphenol oxidase